VNRLVIPLIAVGCFFVGCFFVGCFVAPASASEVQSDGSLDPLFTKLKFSEWKNEKSPVPFKWNVEIDPIVLSNHQRFLTQINVRIDGEELLSRKGNGELVVLFQFQDVAGHLYQDHGILDLRKVEVGAKSEIIVYTETAFVMPGNYPLSIGILDTTSNNRWFRGRDTLHVPVNKNDPLPFSWRDLPAVEFRPPVDIPDRWFLPTVTSKLHLPLPTRHPLKVEVLVNLTPSERATASQRIQDRNLSVLLPTLKVLSQFEMKTGGLNIESVDLERQKVTFRQEAVKQIDWLKLRGALTADQIGTIDVKSLGDREHSAQFFLGEVGKRVRVADVLIVLSSAVRFEQGMDTEPIHAAGTPDCRVFYIRYHAPPVRYVAQQTAVVRGRRVISPPGRGVVGLGPVASDQLEPMLKPLKHKLYDVQTPEEMRKALADLMNELSVI
jgi:hypothetical protein